MTTEKEEVCKPSDGLFTKISSECNLCCSKYKEVCKIMGLFKGNSTLKDTDNFIKETQQHIIGEGIEW